MQDWRSLCRSNHTASYGEIVSVSGKVALTSSYDAVLLVERNERDRYDQNGGEWGWKGGGEVTMNDFM